MEDLLKAALCRASREGKTPGGWAQWQCDRYNERPGKLTGYDCAECLNKGYIQIAVEDEICMRPCKCQPIRASVKAIAESGLTDILRKQRFDTFTPESPWQKELKLLAENYTENLIKWFFVGGQVGAGKTHICTAVLNVLLERGIPCRYMMWRDDVKKIKGNADDFDEQMDKLKEIKVLYIDDFLKTQNGKTRTGQRPIPSEAEVNAAFELINARCIDSEKITIISSEYYMDEIVSIDSGLGSRIFQRCREFKYEIGRDDSRNMRLSGA